MTFAAASEARAGVSLPSVTTLPYLILPYSTYVLRPVLRYLIYVYRLGKFEAGNKLCDFLTLLGASIRTMTT